VSLLNIITELKKTCNHPFLFESAEDEYRCGQQQQLHCQWLPSRVLDAGLIAAGS
jgi:SNF2 family DNA or RNA helicase